MIAHMILSVLILVDYLRCVLADRWLQSVGFQLKLANSVWIWCESLKVAAQNVYRTSRTASLLQQNDGHLHVLVSILLFSAILKRLHHLKWMWHEKSNLPSHISNTTNVSDRHKSADIFEKMDLFANFNCKLLSVMLKIMIHNLLLLVYAKVWNNVLLQMSTTVLILSHISKTLIQIPNTTYENS